MTTINIRMFMTDKQFEILILWIHVVTCWMCMIASSYPKPFASTSWSKVSCPVLSTSMRLNTICKNLNISPYVAVGRQDKKFWIQRGLKSNGYDIWFGKSSKFFQAKHNKMIKQNLHMRSAKEPLICFHVLFHLFGQVQNVAITGIGKCINHLTSSYYRAVPPWSLIDRISPA